jgi:hypothetical protein
MHAAPPLDSLITTIRSLACSPGISLSFPADPHAQDRGFLLAVAALVVLIWVLVKRAAEM